MPELPEVETVCRGLEAALAGKRITRVIARRPDLRIPLPEGFGQRLTGARITHFSRRAKYILAALSTGETLIIHLGMSGRVLISHNGAKTRPGAFHHTQHGPAKTDKHDHVVIEAEDGTAATYNDHRRFGLMDLAATNEIASHKLFKGLGPEPLDAGFDAATLSAALKSKNTPIKSALLDQRVVAGLGNIYVCEALYRAGISPKRRASTIAGARAVRLVPEIKAVLREAIKAGGSTLRDFAHADGELGYFQHNFRVYDREGEPCRTKGCKGTIRRIVQAGRSTFFCSQCQR